MRRKKKCVFTLVEIVTVITVIGVLVGITIGVASYVMQKARRTKNEALVKRIELALQQYKNKYGFYPRQSAGPTVLFMDHADPAASTGSSAPSGNMWQFFDESFKNSFLALQTPGASQNGANLYYVIDADGYPLVYRCPGFFNKGGFDLGSVGPDGFYGDRQGTRLLKKEKGVKDAASHDPTAIPSTGFNQSFGLGDDVVNFNNSNSQ